nr:ribosomal protein S19 [Cuscuta australis]
MNRKIWSRRSSISPEPNELNYVQRAVVTRPTYEVARDSPLRATGVGRTSSNELNIVQRMVVPLLLVE